MINNENKICRVRASVYPTPHNNIWLSSGRVPLHKLPNRMIYKSLSVGGALLKIS